MHQHQTTAPTKTWTQKYTINWDSELLKQQQQQRPNKRKNNKKSLYYSLYQTLLFKQIYVSRINPDSVLLTNVFNDFRAVKYVYRIQTCLSFTVLSEHNFAVFQNIRRAAASNTIQGGEVIAFNTRLKSRLLFPLSHFPAVRLFRPFQKAKSNRKKLAVTSACAKRTGSDVSVFVTHRQWRLCMRNPQAVTSLYA